MDKKFDKDKYIIAVLGDYVAFGIVASAVSIFLACLISVLIGERVGDEILAVSFLFLSFAYIGLFKIKAKHGLLMPFHTYFFFCRYSRLCLCGGFACAAGKREHRRDI